VSGGREGRAEAPERVAGAAGRVSVATLVSRVAGLLREAVFAALIGKGWVADAFVYAFRIPNLLRDFFAEGALSSAFVPTFAEAREKEGDERAFVLARRVMGKLVVWAGGIALIGILFAPLVVRLVAWDAPDSSMPLTALLTRIMWPFLPIVALAAVAMGVLNAHRRYFVPALAPAFFNIVSVLGGLALLPLALDPPNAVVVWAGLVVLGGTAQLLVQVPALRAVGWRGMPIVDVRFRDPAVRTVVRRMGPVAIGLAGTNIMLLITTGLASRGVGWPATLNYAFRLVHLPIGMIGVAVGTVVLAAGSRRSAAGDAAGLDGIQRQGLRLNWFLALPAAVGLAVLAEPIIRLIYQRGHFTAADTLDVAEALRWYAGGIVFYAGVKAAAPQFLARGDTRTPMVCSLAGIGANLTVALSLIHLLGFRALALAVAVGAATNYGLLRLLARQRYGRGADPGALFLLRCLLASGALGGVATLAGRWVGPLHGVGGAGALRGIVAALAGFYFVTAWLLGIEEAASLRRRLRRPPPR
jgi:putative peptidoglycan lipid II flippase